MELIEILDKIASENVTATTDPFAIPTAVRGGWISRINAAKERIEKLKMQYSKVLFDTSYPIVVSGGSVCAEMGALLESYKSGTSISANILYEYLAERIEPLMGKERTWLNSFTPQLNLLLKNQMDVFGIGRLVKPVKPQPVSIPNKEALAAHIKTWVVKANGHTPGQYYMCAKLRQKALALGLNTEVYVLLEGLTEKGEIQEYSNLFRLPAIAFQAKGDAKEALTEAIKKYAKAKESANKRPAKTSGRVG